MADRPSQFLEWSRTTFGDIALDPRERTMRFIEEAIELAHASGIDYATIHAIINRVWARPRGTVLLKIGQCLVTLELLAKVIGIDADAEATKELARVQSIPKAEWDRRHAAKVKLGIATLGVCHEQRADGK